MCLAAIGYFLFSSREMKIPKKEPPSDGPTEPKQPRLTETKIEMETITVKECSEFESFKCTLDVDWTALTLKQLNKISKVYFIIRSELAAVSVVDLGALNAVTAPRVLYYLRVKLGVEICLHIVLS